MKIIPGYKIKDIDAATLVEQQITSLQLMERAAEGLADLVAEYADTKKILVFAGPGNNGGDALAVARLLSHRGFDVKSILLNVGKGLSPECEANRNRLVDERKSDFVEITKEMKPFVITDDMTVIDGLFGSGLNKPLTGGFAALVKMINKSEAKVFSIDMPSGLMCEDNTFNNRAAIIKADRTFCVQLPKLAFFFKENRTYTGEISFVDIGLSEKAIGNADADFETVEGNRVRAAMKHVDRFADKNDNGRALLVAGAYRMAGAAAMAAGACVRSGAGILTVHTPQLCTNVIQTLVPEAIVSEDMHEQIFTHVPELSHFDALGVGPGLGTAELTAAAFEQLLSAWGRPVVADADALNLIAADKELLKFLPEGSILTPHAAELERIIGRCADSYERLRKAADLAGEFGIYVVVKGAYTVTVTPQHKFYVNSTGNQGMAKGGSGDVLTGVILALLARGVKPEDAALTGVYVHGLAGDLAAKEKGVIGMNARDIIDKLPEAWMKIY